MAGRNLKYFRINTDGGEYNPDADLVERGYPYVWGERISKNTPSTKAVLNMLDDIEERDFIVAGKSSEIQYIGKAKQKPVFVKQSNHNGILRGYSFSDASSNIEKEFSRVNDCDDIITIPVNWIWKGNYTLHRAQGQGTMCRIKEDLEIEINKLIKKNMNIEKLIKTNKNLILTGAPGVGKTYKTAEIAVALCDETFTDFTDRSKVMSKYKALVDSGQIAFTTFHQSLDYEEFVEGLKPNITNGGQVSYEVKAGIFKQICKKAKEKYDNSKKEPEVLLREQWITKQFNKFVDEQISRLEEKEEIKLTPTVKILEINDDAFIYLQSGRNLNMYFDDIKQACIDDNKNRQDLQNNTNLSGSARHKGLCSYYVKVLDMFYKYIESNNLQFSPSKELNRKEPLQKFVLIIDEINRGNISKIFGELITLLEKDKRLGEENEIKITLPYSPGKFGVPSNLYIIGTMNTADRSIGQIDYALRRRFMFAALKADKSVIENYDKYEGDTKDKALSLFGLIQTFISDNINEDLDVEDLMIGHSYFLCKTEDELKQRLEYEIIPLIREYEKDGIIMVDKKTLNDKIIEWKTL